MFTRTVEPPLAALAADKTSVVSAEKTPVASRTKDIRFCCSSRKDTRHLNSIHHTLAGAPKALPLALLVSSRYLVSFLLPQQMSWLLMQQMSSLHNRCHVCSHGCRRSGRGQRPSVGGRRPTRRMPKFDVVKVRPAFLTCIGLDRPDWPDRLFWDSYGFKWDVD